MELRIIKPFLLITGIVLVWLTSSCYNDNYQTLYPSGGCDTTNVTFTADVWPLISANCTGCHSGGAPSGNISLTNYSDVVAALNGGRFLGSINHDPGYSAMPKGGSKLSDCSILKIENWANQGMPNN